MVIINSQIASVGLITKREKNEGIVTTHRMWFLVFLTRHSNNIIRVRKYERKGPFKVRRVPSNLPSRLDPALDLMQVVPSFKYYLFSLLIYEQEFPCLEYFIINWISGTEITRLKGTIYFVWIKLMKIIHVNF